MAQISDLVSLYKRPPPRKTLSFPWNSDDSTIPQQVHVSMVGSDRMRISWITEKAASSRVEYGTSSGVYDSSIEGIASTYKYITYKSGLIHEAVIGPLIPDTHYYYRCSDDASREFSLKTTPAHLPIKFVIIGDLGQTGWTKSTLDRIRKSNYDMLLLPGDLSYADFWQPSWDSFGRMVEPLASQRPWMVTQGNHEIEKIPLIHCTPFTAYNSRWRMPFEESGSTSNLYYSFDVASMVHVIMLGSYTDFNPGSSQYAWLETDLKKIDRKKTPWVLVIVHAPWYNSNKAHQGEKESVDMRKAMEHLLYNARVDIVFAGHVHAYERFDCSIPHYIHPSDLTNPVSELIYNKDRVYEGVANNLGPMYITVGDGGNREGLSKSFKDPKPDISLFREASFGYGELNIVSSTQAQWIWLRNQDDESVSADTCWLTNLAIDAEYRSE